MAGIKRKALQDEEKRLRQATLGELAQRGIEVFCWCNRCTHNAELPTALLIAQLGPMAAVPEVGARLVCSSCGSKNVATRPAWKGLGQVTRHEEASPQEPLRDPRHEEAG